MNKFKKAFIGFSIVSAVGLVYVVTALRGIPEAFDWNLDEGEEDEQ